MREDSLSLALVRTAMAHRAVVAGVLAELGLHPGQELLLSTLVREGPQPIGRLAERMGVEQPTITKMVRRMEPGGLVRRSDDPADGRRVLVEATPAGRTVAPAIAAAWEAVEAQMFADLDAKERAVLHDLLGRIRGGLAGGCGPVC